MISNAFSASAALASSSSTAHRIKAPRFIYLPERAKLRLVYAPFIMRYRLPFIWTLLALLAPAAATATEPPRDYGLAAAVQALVTVGTRYHYGGSSPDTGFDC